MLLHEHLLLIVHTMALVNRVLRGRVHLFLHLGLINELVLRLGHDKQSVGLVLLILVHFFATDLRPLLKDNPDEALQSLQISLIESH